MESLAPSNFTLKESSLLVISSLFQIKCSFDAAFFYAQVKSDIQGRKKKHNKMWKTFQVKKKGKKKPTEPTINMSVFKYLPKTCRFQSFPAFFSFN